MMTHASSSQTYTQVFCDFAWEELYSSLRQYIKPCVFRANIPSWHGQEYDLVEDIVQEAVTRVFLRMQEAQLGLAPPINSLYAFSKRVALNLCKDLIRKDARLTRPPIDDEGVELDAVWRSEDDAIEAIDDEMELAAVLETTAPIIVQLPPKQRSVLLIDLANLSDDDVQTPGPLAQALMKFDVQLMDYQGPLPVCAVERSRHAASLCIAYKQIRQKFYARCDSLVA